MTLDEIFTALSTRIVEGVMFHEQMSDYYDFLGLRGYKRCHEYHMHCEMKSMRKVHRYFINHYNKLIQEDSIPNPDAIPSSWFRYARQEVDTNTKRSAVRSGIEKWVAWEEKTKKMYQNFYNELLALGEVATANKMMCLICDVDDELKHVYRKHLNLLAVDYDMLYILEEQDEMHNKYKNKKKELYA